MKKILYTLFILVLTLGVQSCNYLDIVPDETSSDEDAFKNPKAAERYLYSCLSFIPKPSSTIGSIDFLTGDEVVTAFEHETFAHFPKGNYTSTNPVISYWTTLFDGMRYSYNLIANIDQVPNLNPAAAVDYKAQAKFLIGYYQYLLIQNYGPSIIIEGVEDINAPSEKFKPREPLDVCVDFAVSMLEEAMKDLPATRTGNELGLPTSVAAKSVKAKLLTMVASPLFNGNTEYYADFNGKDGTPLMPLTYEQGKWEKALQASKEAVAAAESAGHQLYYSKPGVLSNMPEPVDEIHRSLRMALLDKDNSTEVIWGDTRGQGVYDIMSKSAPFAAPKFAYNGVAPTLAMLERFYTANGLPISEDPSFPSKDEWWEMEDTGNTGQNYEEQVSKFNLNREPRFYAWVTFHNGYYEIDGDLRNFSKKTPYVAKYKRGKNGGKLVMKMLKDDVCGRGTRNNNYSPTGYLNKKLVHPLKTPDEGKINYIHPYIALDDLYLLLAEAAVECSQFNLAKKYIDMIRLRAGIPTVDQAWARAKHPEKANSKEGLREIVRQERMVELYLTNQNFWDMRRWKLAHLYFDKQPQGMNISANTLGEYYKLTTYDVQRRFEKPRNYFMPIPQGEINKNAKLVQNPGY